MRKIVCESCKNHWGDYGTWIVFKSCVICNTCRLTAIQKVREMGYGFDHPFLIELSQVEKSK